MPSLGADMTEGTLLEWQMKPGDEVHRGDVVAVVDTDKAAIEVEVFEDGVVEELLVAPGTKVPVGTPLARLRPLDGHGSAPGPVETAATATAAVPAPAAPTPVVPGRVVPQVESPLVRHLAHERGVDLSSVPGTGPNGAIRREDVVAAASALASPPSAVATLGVHSSPLARRRAAELGVDLKTVAGTGPGAAVTERDVVRQAAAGAPDVATTSTMTPTMTPTVPTPVTPTSAAAVAPVEPAVSPADRMLAMRRAIGALMARSKREIPHYYLSTTVDMSNAMTWLRDTNGQRAVDDRLVPAALLLKAAALATRAVPEMNGWWVDDHVEVSEHVHLGVAVALRPSGLVAPAILDADTLDLDTLMTRLRDLVTRARAGRLRQQEMTVGTLTVTNLGDNGADAVFGVIYPPQVALVGFGRVVERPWAQDGLLGVRPCVVTTLAGDHRASDGHRGSRYLAALEEFLQKPEGL
jgi:pyruvate dehydrogenase E2 component (dihydrolipoamide acetyltransferase)